MGFGAFLLLMIFVLALAWGAIWIMGKVSPNHPVIFDYIAWGVAGLIIIVTLLNATGVSTYDPMIPRVR